MMKPDDKTLFETFMASHPEFLETKTWAAGPDPPDVVINDTSGRRIGVELTEWLDDRQATPSISKSENEYQWFTTLNTENSPPPQNFQYVQISFRGETRPSPQDLTRGRREFYELTSRIDNAWRQEMAGSPQKIWIDFSAYPTLRKHISYLRFEDRMFRARPTRWAIARPKGGAYDPRWQTQILIEQIESKAMKPNYANLKVEYALAKLVLVVHRGIRAILHNTPFEGMNRTIENIVSETRTSVKKNSPSPFDQIFLYLAYNEGALFTLYP